MLWFSLIFAFQELYFRKEEIIGFVNLVSKMVVMVGGSDQYHKHLFLLKSSFSTSQGAAADNMAAASAYKGVAAAYSGAAADYLGNKENIA